MGCMISVQMNARDAEGNFYSLSCVFDYLDRSTLVAAEEFEAPVNHRLRRSHAPRPKRRLYAF